MDDRLKNLISALSNTLHLSGDVWECGVGNGDTAIQLHQFMVDHKDSRTLHLFDTFTGMPLSSIHDIHKVGSMKGLSALEVQKKFSSEVAFHVGIMPSTFNGLESHTISVVNIDVDNYDSVKACLEFIYPRTVVGGYIFLDDYGCGSCPGAKKAVDQFMVDKPEKLVPQPDYKNPQRYFIKI